MNRLLTGIQPTGSLHIGNYLGAIKQIIELQNDYECFVMIADLHALTIPQEPKNYQNQILDVVATLIACGLDTTKTTLFIQSAIPEHLELAWIFSTLTPMGELERMTQYKEKSDKHGQNVGLLTYPVLQAADILLYHPQVVPVGEDQVQHIELTRTISKKFNSRYSQTFGELKTLLNKSARIMALNDPTKKMSKSVVGSAINLDDTPEQITKTIMGAVTDTRPDGTKSAGVNNLFNLLKEFAQEKVTEFEKNHSDGTIQYSQLKEVLARAIIKTLTPITQKKKELLLEIESIKDIIQTGNQTAQKIASQTMIDIKQKVGL